MKLYVLIRKDLSTSHQMVQGGHAVAEFCRKYPNSEWGYHSLVYLGVPDEGELKSWKELFELYNDNEVVEFREPWWDNRLTAVAVLGTDLVQSYVKTLQLI